MADSTADETRLCGLRELADLTGRSPSTIRQWKHRGVVLPSGERKHLAPAGLSRNGHYLYRLVDVQVIVNALEQRSSPGPRAPQRTGSEPSPGNRTE